MSLVPQWLQNAWNGQSITSTAANTAVQQYHYQQMAQQNQLANTSHTHTTSFGQALGTGLGNVFGQAYGGTGGTVAMGAPGTFTQSVNHIYGHPPSPKVHNIYKCASPKEAFEKAAVFIGMLPDDQTLIVVGHYLIAIDKLVDTYGLTIQIPPGFSIG